MSMRATGGRENRFTGNIAMSTYRPFHSQGMQDLELLQKASGYLSLSLRP